MSCVSERVWCLDETIHTRAQPLMNCKDIVVCVMCLLVVSVGALCVVHVAGKHVVIHVDGATVVDGVAQPLGHHSLAGVGGQAQLEEAGLRGGQAVVWLRKQSG